MIKIGSQFSGIGAFEQAFVDSNIEHENIMAVEFDKYARQTYIANFGEPKHYFVDSYDADYDNVEQLDVFLSSPPCQSFSLAGKRLGENDPRGLLFFETLRFIRENNPKYFIIENVKGLLSDNDGKTFQSWIDLLGQSVNGNPFFFPHEDSLMYNLHWQVLNTKDYGLPQNRERVFLVGIRNDLPNSFVFPKGVPLKLRLKDILEDIVDEKYYLSEKMLELLTYEKKGSTEIANINKGGQKGSVISEDSTHVGCLSATDYKLPKLIQVQSATKSGYEIATEGDSINLEHPNSETRRGRVGKQVAQTLTTSCNQGIMVVGNYHKSGHEASRIVNEEGIYPTVKENHGTTPAVMIKNGTSNCLSTVQKDNLVVEGIIQLNNPKHSNDRIYSDEGLAPTLNTMQGGNRQPFIQVIGSTGGKNDHNSRIYGTDGISPTILAGNNGGGQSPVKHLTHDYRIRKLTPKECFRLQGFPDEFVKPVSNSQLYKQAGNTISVNVIQAILKNLLVDYLK